MPHPPSLVFGEGDEPIENRDYKLIKELGSGGFGQVWEASGEGLGHVALKIVNLAGLKEAKRELWALQRINTVEHPNLASVQAAYVIDRDRRKLDPEEWNSESAVALVIVMKLCEKSLQQLLEECRAAGLPGIPRDDLLRYMEGAARGLDYLHKPSPSQGRDSAIVHCDIKPLNILIAGGEPMICDFGLARVFDSGDTKYTTQLGSIAYMPPEVLLGGRAATPPSDQYSLAISYIELRTGFLPFGSGEQVTLGHVTSALNSDSHNLTRLEDAEKDVIKRAIVREPRNRYPTCLAMVEALWAATTEQPKQKSRGLIGKLFGGSDEVAPSRGSGRLTPTSPSGQRQRKPQHDRTLLAPQSPSPEEDPSTPVSARDDSARQSTVPPDPDLLDTAPVVPDVSRASWTEELPLATIPDHSPTSGSARLPPKPRRRIPVSIVVVGLLSLGAALVGFEIVPGKPEVVGFAKGVWGRIFPPSVDPSEAFQQEVLALLEAEDFGSVIAKLNSPPDDVRVGDITKLNETASKKWRDVLQRLFDDREFDEAAQLLDPRLSEIADLAEARKMWIAELRHCFDDGKFAEVAPLLDPKLSEIADPNEARDIWGRELDKRLQGKEFAEADQLLALSFVDRFEDFATKRAEARKAWSNEVQRCFDDGKFDEAAGLLDAELSEIADLDEASGMWGKALEECYQERNFAEAARLLASEFADRLADKEGMREKILEAWRVDLQGHFDKKELAEAEQLLDPELSAVANIPAARDTWVTELEKRLEEENFAEAAQLLAPGFVKILDDSKAMQEQARGKWSAKLILHLDDGNFAEAAKLLDDTKLSAIIDRKAGSEAWEAAFYGLLKKSDGDEPDLVTAEKLLKECDPSPLLLRPSKYKGDLDRAKGEWIENLADWQGNMGDFLERKDFDAFIGGLDGPPGEAQEKDVEDVCKDGVKAWSAELKNLLAKGEFVEAAKLFDENLSAIFDRDAARGTWATELGNRFDQREFPEAAELLSDSFSTINNLDTGQAAYRGAFKELLQAGDWDEADRLIRECKPDLVMLSQQELKRDLEEAKINEGDMARRAWLVDVQKTWSAQPESPATDVVLEKCKTFLERSPECAEAHLIETRARMQQQKATQDQYKKFQAIDASSLSQDLKHLHKMLAMFILGEGSDPDWDKIRGSLVDLGANRPAPAGFLQLTDVENGRLKKLRKETLKFLLDRIENLVDSAEFNTAQKDLESAEGLSPDEDQRNDLKYWQAIVNLRDPDSDRKQLDDALASAEQFMSSGRATDIKDAKIAEAMVALAETSSRHVDLVWLDRAMELLRAACDRFEFLDELHQQFSELLVHATRLRIAEPAAPKAGDLAQLEEDWSRTVDADVEDVLVEAWRAECLIRLGQDVEDADGLLDRIANRPEGPANDAYAAYGAYVRALAIDALDKSQSRSDDVLKALDQAVGSPILDKQDRMATAARMILDATEQELPRPGKRAADDYLLNSPFSSRAKAEQYFGLLDEVKGDVDPARQRTFDVGLMLAALHRSDPELKEVWLLASRLAQSSDEDLAASALPVLASCVRVHVLRGYEKTESVDDKIAIGACTRIMGLLQDDGLAINDPIVTNTIATESYEPVVEPLLTIADLYAEDISKGNAPAVDPAVLEEFYAALGRLIWTRQSADWSFPTAEKTKQLFDRAIELHNLRPGGIEAEKATEYHLTCGHAELAKDDRNLDSAEEHAEAVQALIPGYYGAHGLLSNIDMCRSRQQPTNKKRFGLLETAISEGEKAVEKAPPEESLLATWLPNLGTAYVERANFTRDPSLQKQKADLNRAIVHATRAANMENTYPDYPYLILGNAYEDLAWLVGEDVEDNYQKAIENFRTAAERETYNPAMALRSLGRCYYKIVADSYVDTSEWDSGDLKGLNAEEVMTEAEKLLEKTIDLKPDLADAFLWLSRVQKWRGKKEEAAKNDERYRSLINIDTSEEARDAKARLTQISSLVFQKKYVEALSEISLALPANLDQAESEDAWTIQQSVRCRIGQIDKSGWSWATAIKALEEAEFAVNLAYTPKGLSESFYLRARVHHAIAVQVGTPKADTPERFQETVLSQFSDGLSDYRDAFRLVPFPKPSMVTHLKSATETAERRYYGVNLLQGKAATINSNPDIAGALSRNDRQRYIEELTEGIRWADEFLLLAGDNPQNKNIGTEAKATFEEHSQKQSEISAPPPETE